MSVIKSFFLSIALLVAVHGFAPLGTSLPGWGLRDFSSYPLSKAIAFQPTTLSASEIPLDDTTAEATLADETERTAVRAPLKFIGPYPALALRFPDLATDSQRQRNVSGISLDFVLDTAANVNTLSAQVAKELQLDVVGHALPGVASVGAIDGGEIFLLGDAQLEGINETFTFMTNLTASALPIASPAAAGLLSLAFLQCFGGVQFDWGNVPQQVPPSVTFYEQVPQSVLDTMQPVSIQRIPVTQLPSVTVEINGVQMPALLDTGSPVTVLNSHSHADHVGGNYAFTDILSTMDDFAIARSRGLPHEAVAEEVSPQALCRGLPDGLMASEHVLRPYPLAERIRDGEIIDLGGRQLEVIAVPGHTPDAIALLERAPGYLWTGDSFYVGPIWLYAPETDFDAYRASMARLAALAPELTALFPAHNTPEADPGLLVEALAGFDAMRAGEIESQPEWPGTVTYPVGSFSFLVRDDAFDPR